MANAYSSLATTGTNLVQTAYDRLVEFQLRSMPFMRALVDKRPVQQAMPGSTVTFQLWQDLAVAKTPLTEIVDPDSVSIPATTTVSVTLNEYGNAALATRKLRLLSLSDVDPAFADVIAFNMVNSLDEVIRDVALTGTNVIGENAGNLKFTGFSRTATVDTDIIKSRDARAAVTALRNRNALPRNEETFIGYIHPSVSYDLRSEAGTSAAWRPPHEYSAAGNIWAGSIGTYEGIEWIESPRCFFTNDGSGASPKTNVFRTLVFGRQALVEASAEDPHTVIGPVTDKLMRHRPIGWYGLLGWSIYRQECLQRIECASSLVPAS